MAIAPLRATSTHPSGNEGPDARLTWLGAVRTTVSRIPTLIMLAIGVLFVSVVPLGPTGTRAAAPDINGIFIDGWYPETGQAYRPVTIRTGLAVESDESTIFVGGTATGMLTAGSWRVGVDNGAFPIELGHMPRAFILGPSSVCGQQQTGYAEVTELERLPDGTVTRFSADVHSKCGSSAATPFVHAIVRYHATTGFQAYDMEPQPALRWQPAATLDFGDRPNGTASAPQTVTVSNTGTDPISVDVTPPATTAFDVDADACANATLAAGTSCVVEIRFTPQAVGAQQATLAFDLAGFVTADRSLVMAGTGTGTASTKLTAITFPSEDQSLDGMFWFSIATSPVEALGTFDLAATCGDAVTHAYPGSSGSDTPREVWLDLPPGPCEASVTFTGMNGWTGTGDGPIAFTVPSFTSTWMQVFVEETQLYNDPIAARPLHVVVHVDATNGSAPTGGTVTLTDLLTGTVLGSGPLDPATRTVELDVPPLGSGVHDIRAAFSGDAGAAPSHVTGRVTVDADPPQGTATVSGGRFVNASGSLAVVLSATDAGSAVAALHVATDPAVDASGELIGGTRQAPADMVAWMVGAPDGTKDLYVQWMDTAGNWSVPLHRTVVLDLVAPAATAPSVCLGAAGRRLSGSRLPIQITWSGSDDRSGIARFELSHQADGDGWTPASTTTDTTAVTFLAAGHTDRFRIRAVDAAGNASAWATGDTFRLAAVQQSSSKVSWHGAWSTSDDDRFWRGSTRTTRRAGATATVTFTGRTFSWVALTGPGRGKAAVYVDGIKAATVDLGAATRTYRRIAWTGRWPSHATRTVTIKALGTAGRPRIEVDGFAWTR